MKESVISQSNEEVKTDSLYMTSITTPTEKKLETLEIINTGTRTLMNEELPLQRAMDNEKEKFSSSTHTVESEGKEKLCTRVMNETTLRIYCQKKLNTEPFTQDLSSPTALSTVQEKTVQQEAIDIKEKTNLRG